MKQKGFSSKDLPLLIFPRELVANWHQLLSTLTEPELDASHMRFPPLRAGKANAGRPPRPPDGAQCRGGWVKLIVS